MTSNKPASRPSGKGQPASILDIYEDYEDAAEILLTVQLVLAARRWRSLLDEQLRRIDQSSARMEALAAIANSPALPAQVDIARRLRIEGPTLTRMLDTLEKDGLVERLADPDDRRSKKLRLTARGREALDEIFGVAEVYRARLLEDVPPEMLDTVNDFLRMLMGRLDEGLPDPGPPA